ncbi:shikimate kinase [Candidatus Liberibacter sp.]|uniref:shikimate kinase n=1 Tax=Candidatus Liberibacter sp. TaxID=34022 RepID=UPI0015F7677A|nr:shikimate kinase [Candidatus Liberibacter sp.]MBA5724005.1 shikimate kinase [Candidatus Liberibacter sp.]
MNFDRMCILLRARATLREKKIILVGLMGAGKTTIGRMVSFKLKIPFVDIDCEIEKLSSMTIQDLFHIRGEDVFRSLELQVLKTVLQGGPCVIATGGGTFINDKSREYIQKKGISLWLKVDFDILWTRIKRKDNRPLLDTVNPQETLRDLMASRHPIYAQADMILHSSNGCKDETANSVIRRLADFRYLERIRKI